MRDVPSHVKGYKNEWGALLEHQAEVQSALEEEAKNKELQRQSKYRQELSKQLAMRKQKQDIEMAQRHNLTERQTLEENAKRFEQKEAMRLADQKVRGMTVMDQNRLQEMEKRNMKQQSVMGEKEMFNK